MLTNASALRKDKTSGKGELQHRHFATIAAIIAEMPRDIKRRVAMKFAIELAGTNPRFDRQRFLSACGVSEREDAREMLFGPAD